MSACYMTVTIVVTYDKVAYGGGAVAVFAGKVIQLSSQTAEMPVLARSCDGKRPETVTA